MLIKSVSRLLPYSHSVAAIDWLCCCYCYWLCPVQYLGRCAIAIPIFNDHGPSTLIYYIILWCPCIHPHNVSCNLYIVEFFFAPLWSCYLISLCRQLYNDNKKSSRSSSSFPGFLKDNPVALLWMWTIFCCILWEDDRRFNTLIVCVGSLWCWKMKPIGHFLYDIL